MSCSVGHRCGSDLALLWLWHGPAATALTRPLAWELSYAIGVALKSKKERNKGRRKEHGFNVSQSVVFQTLASESLGMLVKNQRFLCPTEEH